MAYVAFQPASSRKARQNAEGTLHKPVKLEYFRRYLDDAAFTQLQKIYPDCEVFVWGVKVERLPQWDKMVPEWTVALFRRDDRIYLGSGVTCKVWNEELASHLWGPDEDGELWSLIYFLTKPRQLEIPAPVMTAVAGMVPTWNWQGFVVLSPPESDDVLQALDQYL